MNLNMIKKFFLLAALYDIILGAAFLIGFKQIYSYFNIALPNHDGYIQFAASLVTIFGIGFWYVSNDPVRNRDIIKLGILLKLAYSSVVFTHIHNIPGIWVPFAWVDLIFLVLFLWTLRFLKSVKT